MNKTSYNILLFIFVSILTLILIEIILKVFFPIYLNGYIGAYCYDEELGVKLKENLHFHKTTDYQQEIITNNIGSLNLESSFSEYEMLIFTIGDSYTQGSGLPFDASYPFQLSIMLNLNDSKYSNKFGVVNLGLAAYGTEQATLSLVKFSKIIKTPKYVLYLGCSNDYMDDIFFKNGNRHSQLVDGNPHFGIFLKPLQWLTNSLELGKRFKIAIGLFRNKFSFNEEQIKIYENNQIRNVAELQRNKLEKLLSITKKINAKLIVSWADSPRSSSNSYNWLKYWAKEEKIGFADWHKNFEYMLKGNPTIPTENPHSGGHYRTWVNSIIAQSFFKQIHEYEVQISN